MASRIPVSWIFLLALLCVMAFFGYHILQASYSSNVEHNIEKHADDAYIHSKKSVSFHPEIVANHHEEVPEPQHAAHPSAEDLDAAVMTQPVPKVPGQTEHDLRATRQVQETPPSIQYDTPEAMDPLNRTVHMDSEFGSNLRHPEQMIERRPHAGIAGIVPSGLGSETSRPGGNNAAGYAPEMAQNGGEFMNGIAAFDGSDGGGIGYSLL